ARDLGGAVEADLEGRARDGRSQQEIVALEEAARVLLPREAVEPGLDVLGGSPAAAFVGDRDQARVDIVAPLAQRGAQARRDAAQEHGPPRGLRARPLRRDFLDAAAQLSEAPGRPRARRG